VVSQEYAKALYELSVEEKCLEDTREQLRAVYKTAYKDSDCYEVMTSLFISKDEKKKIITNVFKNIISETLLDFLYVLIDHNRFNLLRDIRKEFDKFIREENKILMVQVKSVKPLSEEEIDNVRKALKHKYTKQTLEIENVIDEDILGGFQIIVEDEVIDYTLKSGLLRLKESI